MHILLNSSPWGHEQRETPTWRFCNDGVCITYNVQILDTHYIPFTITSKISCPNYSRSVLIEVIVVIDILFSTRKISHYYKACHPSLADNSRPALVWGERSWPSILPGPYTSPLCLVLLRKGMVILSGGG